MARAIVGSIVALSTDERGVPDEWLGNAEPIPPPWPVPA
jgi:hypothetical protein